MGPKRGYARTLVVGALSIALASTVSVGGAHAESPSGFSNGTAQAVAQVFRVAPGIGSLQLATSLGASVSQIANNLAQAQAQSIDLGLVGTALTAEKCDGSPGALTPDQLPHPTQVDNRQGDASASSDEVPISRGTVGGGHEEAEADNGPASHAVVSSVDGVLGPLATISGGRSEALTRVVEGKAREAESTVSVDLDIAGVVQLRDVKWRAFHRTGADPTADGTFTIASASALGVPLPLDQLKPAQDAINLALAPSGVTVEFPSINHITSPNDVIRVTPLRITLKDSPAGKAALGPGLNLTRPQREQLFNTVMGIDCQLAGALLVGDISVSVASGTGFIIIEVGGVEATSSDLVLGNPFGSEPPLVIPPADVVTPPELPPLVKPPTYTNVSHAAPAQQLTSDTGPIERLCETLHPSKSPGCSKGSGLPIGIAGLALTGAIAFLDWRRQRRLLAAEATVS